MRVLVLQFFLVLVSLAVAAEGNLCADGDVESGVAGWNLPPQYRIEAGVGVGGSSGLVFSNASSEVKSFMGFRRKVSVKPGRTYRMSMELKRRPDFKSNMFFVIFSTYDKDMNLIENGQVFRADANAVGRDGWELYAGRTKPLGGKVAYLGIGPFVSKGSTGSFVVDDFAIVEEAYRPLGPLSASAYRNVAAEGEVRFAAEHFLSEETHPPESLAATLVYAGPDGTERRRPMRIAGGELRAQLDVASLKFGESRVACELATASGAPVGTSALTFTRVAKLPSRRVAIDARNRFVVDGRPFLPLVATFSDRKQVKDYEGALAAFDALPFNVVMDYDKDLSREKLDFWHARGRKVICSLKDLFVGVDGKAWAPPGVRTEADEEAWTRKVVERCRNHPALFAWYVNDEFPVSAVSRCEKRYELLKALDADHPALISIDVPSDIRAFLGTCDVVGTDPYPVGAKGDLTDSALWTRTTHAQAFGMRPVCQTLQMFDTSWYWPKGTYADMRLPTKDEIRTQAWLCLCEGANALGFYSYTALWNNLRMNAPAGGQAAFDKTVGELRDILDELVELTPFVLSDEESPAAKVSASALSARAWRLGAELLVAVANPTRKAVPATVALVGAGSVPAFEVEAPPVGTVLRRFRLDGPELSGSDGWGGLPSHPAVLNPACGVEPDTVVGLGGTWEFTAITGHVTTLRKNTSPHAFFRAKDWGKGYHGRRLAFPPRPIQVPGVWEAQGVGEPGMGEGWLMTDNSEMPIRHKLMADGWFKRMVDVPAAWKGKRIWLKLGGIRGEGHFWVNDRPVAWINDYCATRKYDVTAFVTPGEPAKIVAEIDNRAATYSGCLVSRHRWGGFFRAPELEATPECFIDDAWAEGDFDRQEAKVHVEVGGLRSEVGGRRLRVTIEGETIESQISNASSGNQAAKQPNNQTILKVPLRNFRPWSPEHPNLYTARVELVSNGRTVQTRFERFGVRKLEMRGGEFYLNGRPLYLRGFGDDNVYPLDGMTRGDRAFHRAHLAKARAAGFNQVRLHTHCEVPEYFDAADELGILVMPELPYYNDVPTEYGVYDPKRHLRELHENYRRHPSFALWGMGNEGSHGPWMDRELYRYAKELAPERLAIGQSGSFYSNGPVCSDFNPAHQELWEGKYPELKIDRTRPFTVHEYLNLSIKSDYRDERDYTGAWLPPETAAKRAAFMAKAGLDMTWGERLQDAQIALQRVWQKEGVEKARRDPDCDGFCFWTIVDVVVYNRTADSYSAQGLFDPFWRPKRGGFTPDEFAVFNSASCVLLDSPVTNRVFSAGENFAADVLLSHYGERALGAATLDWRFAADGRTLASGNIDLGRQTLGAARKVGTVACRVPDVDKACKATLEVTVCDAGATVARNSWEHWFFPKSSLADVLARAKSAGVTVAASGSAEAEDARRSGRPAVIVGPCDGEPNVRLGWWWMGRQMGMALADHQALRHLPHEGVLSPLLFRIVKGGQSLPADSLAPRDHIIVGEGGDACYSYLAERRCPNGARQMLVNGLDILSGHPEGTALLQGLVEHLTEEARK